MPEATDTATLIERVRAVLPHHQEESTIGAIAALLLRLVEDLGEAEPEAETPQV